MFTESNPELEYVTSEEFSSSEFMDHFSPNYIHISKPYKREVERELNRGACFHFRRAGTVIVGRAGEISELQKVIFSPFRILTWPLMMVLNNPLPSL